MTVNRNLQRESFCSTYTCPPPVLPGQVVPRDPSPYQYCCVQPTYCVDNAEVLAYYDGDDENLVGQLPNFNLYDENSPGAGINISYIGARTFSTVRLQLPQPLFSLRSDESSKHLVRDLHLSTFPLLSSSITSLALCRKSSPATSWIP